MSLLTRLLSGRITRGRLTIIAPDGTPTRFGTPVPGWGDVTLRIRDAAAERRILMNPALGLGETYMDGSVTVDDDDIMGLVTLVQANSPWEAGDTIDAPRLAERIATPALRLGHQLNTRIASRRNVAHHYDLSNDFYRLWLDEDLQYSCAYWPDLTTGADGAATSALTLEQAQAAKRAHIIAKLDLKAGQRVLDIGCGWGGMAIAIARAADVEVLGITLSEEQLKLARERAAAAGLADRVKFVALDYRDLVREAPNAFDRIVSVGMFEHVGAPQFETFFRAAANLMPTDGVMLLHTIGRMGSPGATDAFTRKYIFPGGYIPALSETVAASEKARLIATDVETLRMHYAATLRGWDARVKAHRAAIEAMFDARFYRMWLFYLAGAAVAFEHGGLCNYQIQYARSRRALPVTRDYIGARERELDV